tara:strand:+ start:1501 stop:1650 length:150 start_codon:yes stop_codon:yes gene_type:complete
MLLQDNDRTTRLFLGGTLQVHQYTNVAFFEKTDFSLREMCNKQLLVIPD